MSALTNHALTDTKPARPLKSGMCPITPERMCASLGGSRPSHPVV
jgi:hypothetical protein